MKYLRKINDCISFPFSWTIIPPSILWFEWLFRWRHGMQIFFKTSNLDKNKIFQCWKDDPDIEKMYLWAFVHSKPIDACVRKVEVVECSLCLRSFNRGNVLSDTQRQDKIRFSCTNSDTGFVCCQLFSQRLN